MDEILAMAIRRDRAAAAPIVEEAERTDQRADIAAKPQPKCEPAKAIAPPVPAVQPREVEPAASLAVIISTHRSDEPPLKSSAREAVLAGVAAQRLPDRSADAARYAAASFGLARSTWEFEEKPGRRAVSLKCATASATAFSAFARAAAMTLA